MKNSRSPAAAALFLAVTMGAGTLHAQSQDTLEVQARKISPLEAKEIYDDFKGAYAMSDGSLFSFRRIANRYVALIDGHAPAELKYAGEQRFVTAAGRTEFRFAFDHRQHATVVITRDHGTVIAGTGASQAAL